ncbi:MAG: hypothetical protein HKN03_07655 [Acidimicrobiales bacterium]|nr:hypothetical protein [Acidimicrobiales bacterium]
MNSPALLHRVLDQSPCPDLDHYLERGGGRALQSARKIQPEVIVDLITESGLRGRGGAGFPTGVKWRTVAENHSGLEPSSVVINGAEGEPGTFKDRTLIRRNPYKILEGALIAAHAVGSSEVIVCLKETFEAEIALMARAIFEVTEAGWAEPGAITIVLGPRSYLFGEETGLLEVINGRQPFPRVTPPYRRGIEEYGLGQNASSDVELAAPGIGGSTPVLVNNVETLANVPAIVTGGSDAFRALGTKESPGTLLCTISGDTQIDGVAELEMGTTIGDAIQLIGHGPTSGRSIQALVSGVANPILPTKYLQTPLTYEAMADIGSSLGAGGFMVFDDTANMVAVAQGIIAFLAIESCGQCQPCKADGLEMASLLDEMRINGGGESATANLDRLAESVTNEARCYLAQQQQNVVRGLLAFFPAALVERSSTGSPGLAGETGVDIPDPVLIAPISDIAGGQAIVDAEQVRKNPDWSYQGEDSGSVPAERLAEVPVRIPVPDVDQP